MSNIGFLSGDLHSQEFLQCDCMFNVCGVLKIDIVMAVTAQAI